LQGIVVLIVFVGKFNAVEHGKGFAVTAEADHAGVRFNLDAIRSNMMAPIAAETTSPISPGMKAMPYNGKMKQATIGPEMPTMILLSGQIRRAKNDNTRVPTIGRTNNEPNEGSNACQISGFPIGSWRVGLCPAKMS
jgi:hypothetical protein